MKLSFLILYNTKPTSTLMKPNFTTSQQLPLAQFLEPYKIKKLTYLAKSKVSKAIWLLKKKKKVSKAIHQVPKEIPKMPKLVFFVT